MSRIRKTDTKQRDVSTAFRGLGCSIVDLHALGKGGVPDLLVGVEVGVVSHVLAAVNVLVEVKTEKDDRNDQSGGVSEGQRTFAAEWRGVPVWLISSVEEAVAMVQFLRGRPGAREPERKGGFLGYGLDRWIKS
jgi:hypothetical protein